MKGLEKIRYKFYKWRLRSIAKRNGPLIRVYFLSFIEFELDDIFQKGGMAAVKKAVEGWSNESRKLCEAILDRLTEMLIV